MIMLMLAANRHDLLANYQKRPAACPAARDETCVPPGSQYTSIAWRINPMLARRELRDYCAEHLCRSGAKGGLAPYYFGAIIADAMLIGRTLIWHSLSNESHCHILRPSPCPLH